MVRKSLAIVTLAILPLACAKGLSDPSGAGGEDSWGTSNSQASSSVSGSSSSAGGSTASSSSANSSSTSSSSASSSSASSSGASTSIASSSGASSSIASSSSGAGGAPQGCPAAPSNLMGCPGCGATCDSPWPVSWSAVPGATHYIVEYTCFIMKFQYQTMNTSADLCMQVGMCNNNVCANGVGPVTVKACDMFCCSTPATVPASDTPIACGGGVCC